MTIEKVLRLADEIKPNALSPELKIHYISEVEGIIQSDVMLIASPGIIVYGVDDLSAELLVRPPHDKLYLEYLVAMIDFAHGEYNRYTNTITRFNTDLAAYTAWYASRFHPIDGGVEESGYYLSAYAIAVAHGFDGSEAEWLLTLRGPAGKGDPGKDGEPGENGKTAEFRYSGDYLEWKYTDEDDTAWRTLIAVSEISGYAESAAESAKQAAESASSIGDEVTLANEAAERAAASADAAAKSAQDAVGAAGGGVSTFNGRSGIVVPQKEDYRDHYAEKEHEHDGYALSEHTHDGYADTDHTHEGYAASEHTHDYSETYAAAEHGHSTEDISGFSEAVSALIPSVTSGAQIAVGSYTGNGLTGEKNAISFTFDFEPKFVLVIGNKDTAFLTNLVTNVLSEGDESGQFYCNSLESEFDGKTVKWFLGTEYSGDAFAEFMLNKEGKTYVYIAIG